jgi:hypothetical protein
MLGVSARRQHPRAASKPKRLSAPGIPARGALRKRSPTLTRAHGPHRRDGRVDQRGLGRPMNGEAVLVPHYDRASRRKFALLAAIPPDVPLAEKACVLTRIA